MATTTAMPVSGVQMIALDRHPHRPATSASSPPRTSTRSRGRSRCSVRSPRRSSAPTPASGIVLVAGHKRYAALRQLGQSEIRAEIRSAEAEHAERAAENVVASRSTHTRRPSRSRAMLDSGLTEDGAAQALGWPKQRVTARMRLLELPETAQQMVGARADPASAPSSSCGRSATVAPSCWTR